MLLTRVAKDKTLPFEALNPNEDTINAMREARKGNLVTAGKPSDLLSSLNADD